MRLIDADALARRLHDDYHGAISDSELKVYQVIRLLDDAPTVDAVPVSPPQPLTLEELKGMDGKPVWVEDGGEAVPALVNIKGDYPLCEREAILLLSDGNFYLLKEYLDDNFLAYPTEPGREDLG